ETKEPERYYAAADAFVLPSAYETFSLAALEAAATGLPVVATNVGIVGGLVAAGGGVFVDRDPDSIATALERLAERPEELPGMAECARDYARGFGWEAAVDAYLGLYAE